MPRPLSTSELRYLVLLPSLDRPVGGANVLLWMTETLREAGHDVAALQARRNYNYAFRNFSGPRFYSRELDKLFRKGLFPQGRRARLWQIFGNLQRDLMGWRAGRAHLPDWGPAPGDILIVPEFMYPEAVAAFPELQSILVVQDVFGLMRASLRSRRWLGGQPERFAAVISTSAACASAARAVLGSPGLSFILPVCHHGLDFNPDKKLQIALMPRKRREEARILQALIRAHPELQEIPLVEIDHVPEAEAHRILRESLIFLSLSDQEGFGLPPAEAMATGSLVIGYTGVGGEEYFTAENGFPIPDGDITAFLERLVEVVRAWRQNPEPLDTKRRSASEFVWSRYDENAARQSLKVLWGGLKAQLRNGSE